MTPKTAFLSLTIVEADRAYSQPLTARLLRQFLWLLLTAWLTGQWLSLCDTAGVLQFLYGQLSRQATHLTSELIYDLLTAGLVLLWSVGLWSLCERYQQ